MKWIILRYDENYAHHPKLLRERVVLKYFQILYNFVDWGVKNIWAPGVKRLSCTTAFHFNYC